MRSVELTWTRKGRVRHVLICFEDKEGMEFHIKQDLKGEGVVFSGSKNELSRFIGESSDCVHHDSFGRYLDYYSVLAHQKYQYKYRSANSAIRTIHEAYPMDNYFVIIKNK